MLPDPHCLHRMAPVDSLPREFRDLANEYGAAIVLAMRDDGYFDPVELRELLEVRRRRRQDAWRATDFITPASRQGFMARLAAAPQLTASSILR